MRKTLLTLTFLMALVGVSFAGVIYQGGMITQPSQRARDGVQTITKQVSSNSEVITGMTITSAATAQVCGVFDVAQAQDVAWSSGSTTAVFEASAPANTTAYFDFTGTPILTKNGIYVYCTRSDGSYLVYTQH